MWDPLIRSFFPNTPPLHLYFSLSERMVAGPDPSSPPNPTLACLLARWTVGPGRSRSAAHSSPRAVLLVLDATRSWGRTRACSTAPELALSLAPAPAGETRHMLTRTVMRGRARFRAIRSLPALNRVWAPGTWANAPTALESNSVCQYLDHPNSCIRTSPMPIPNSTTQYQLPNGV